MLTNLLSQVVLQHQLHQLKQNDESPCHRLYPNKVTKTDYWTNKENEMIIFLIEKLLLIFWNLYYIITERNRLFMKPRLSIEKNKKQKWEICRLLHIALQNSNLDLYLIRIILPLIFCFFSTAHINHMKPNVKVNLMKRN